MHPGARSRRYPALEAWQRAARGPVTGYPWNHPLSQAARHEANARELDALTDTSRTPLGAATWHAAADYEMAQSVEILANAERSLRVASGEAARG